MRIRDEKLVPLAQARVDAAVALAQDVTTDDFRDEVAGELYRAHRGSGSSEFRFKVKEKTWDTIPSSQKGWYRNIVREAIAESERKRKAKARRRP